MQNPTNSLRLKAQRGDSDAHADHVPDLVASRKHIDRDQQSLSSMKRPDERSIIVGLGRWLTRSLAAMAVVSCVALVAVGAAPLFAVWSVEIGRWAAHGWASMKVPLSALPLLLAGASYILLQSIVRPPPLELLKRLMLGAAFLLWGITQLMPVNVLAAELGNIVIALYVIDLGLIIRSDLRTVPAN